MITNTQALGLGILSSLLSMSCHAQSDTAPSNWEISIGPALISAPKGPGSKERRNLVIPFFEAKGPNGLFVNVERGFGQELALGENARFAYSLALDLNSRRRGDDDKFANLDDIKEAVAPRVEYEQEFGPFTFNVTAFTRLAKASEAGSSAITEFTYRLTENPNFLVSVGANAKFADTRFARSFFGVNTTQAAASGLPVYEAGAGLYRVAPLVQVLATINYDWTAFARFEAGRLRGDAADSPVVSRTRGDIFVISASRTF